MDRERCSRRPALADIKGLSTAIIARHSRKEQMRKRVCVFTFAFLLASLSAIGFAAQAVTNKDIVSMVKAGLSPAVILQTIQSSPGQYDTSPQALIALKAGNVPDAIIEAMIKENVGATPAAATETPISSQAAIAPAGSVFYLYDASNKQHVLSAESIDNSGVKTGGIKNAIPVYGVFSKKGAFTSISGKASNTLVGSGPIRVVVKNSPPNTQNKIVLLRLKLEDGNRIAVSQVGRINFKKKRDIVPITIKADGEDLMATPDEPLEPGNYGFMIGNGTVVWTFDVVPQQPKN